MSDNVRNYVGTDVNSTLYEVLSTGKQSIAADIPKGDINSYMRSSVEQRYGNNVANEIGELQEYMLH